MKTALELNVSTHLTLTPQLQQAIRLLQLSTIDLQQEIQLAVESNPMLEVTTSEEDFQWQGPTINRKVNLDDVDFNYENLHFTTSTLQDHLRWQLDLTPMSDVDHMMATAIIDAINDDGFLTVSLDDLYTHLNSQNLTIEKDEVDVVRHRVQHFDPLGCGSFNLSESLAVQLQELPKTDEIMLAKQIVIQDLEVLGQHNFQQIKRKYQIDDTILQHILKIIQSLNPKPGSLIQNTRTEYIIPDVIAKKVNGTWQVILNPNTLPKLNINKQYAALIQRADQSDDNQFLKNNLQEARWFLKSIQSRQETLLKVAQCILRYQQDFFDFGTEAMKPLILNDVAHALNMHESTISRVTTQKFLHTPRGVFELKYFFSSHVGTEGGGACSSTAIRAFIKKLISAENRQKPFSDHKISQLMGTKGINIARRTVAKYREALGIPPSNERKML